MMINVLSLLSIVRLFFNNFRDALTVIKRTSSESDDATGSIDDVKRNA